MITSFRTCAAAVALLAASASLPATAVNETIDYDALNRIKQQGLIAANSKVMEVLSALTDVHGPRLTASPNIEKAAEWAMKQMGDWGLTAVAMEPWPAGENNNGFPRGWQNDKFYMHVVAPQAFPIVGTPIAWTPGTNGLQRGNVFMAPATTLEDLKASLSDKPLEGAWIMRTTAPDVPAYWSAPSTRLTTAQLDAMETAPRIEFGVANTNTALGRGGPGGGRGGGAPAPGVTPCQAPGRRGGGGGPVAEPNPTVPPANPCDAWLKSQRIAGTLTTTPRGHGIYTAGGGGNAGADPSTRYAQVAITAEHYGRIARLLARKVPVTIEADIRSSFIPNPPMFNVVAEIKGTDKADEVVMLGAHFDSWHASTGATDNAAGSAAMMEAMRILKQSGVTLRRTVRLGLWTGEEQGLIGSRLYVNAHFGTAPAGRGGAGGDATATPSAAEATAGSPAAAPRGNPAGVAGRAGAPARVTADQSTVPWTPPPASVTIRPDWNRFAAYFNIDNGTGAIRGVYLQQNQAVAPIFREWMEPFRSLGMTHLNPGNTGGTDHQSFDAVGLPAFQFIQDEIEYQTMTHHTNLDSYERIQPEDMRRNATIAAAFAFLAANRDEKLPHKPPTPLVGGGRSGN